MARSRNIKPGFSQNEALADCGPLAQLLFACLWCHADKAGRMEDRPRRIKVQCLPFYDCDVDELLDKLAEAPEPFIVRYEVEGRRYIQITNWERHQKPHHMEPESEIPDVFCAQAVNEPLTSRARVDDESSTLRAPIKVKGIKEEGIKVKAIKPASTQRFVPPTVPEVAAYCTERSNGIDAQAFVDFYKSKGWKVGDQAMKDWQAAVRTWERNHNRGGPGRSPERGVLQL